MRYKRLPHLWKNMGTAKSDEARAAQGEAQGKTTMDGSWPAKFDQIYPKTVPVLEFPDGTSMNESTTIMTKLEAEYPVRPAVPPNRALYFLMVLLEDFADEWLTKVMYGMRWNRQRDIEWSSRLLAMNSSSAQVSATAVSKMASFVAGVQTQRTELVGCADSTIHPTFHAFSRIMNTHFDRDNGRQLAFLLGNLPTIADFAIYGQVSQWVVDRTPNEMIGSYPYFWEWIWRMEDLSGVECPPGAEEWVDVNQMPETLVQLLKLVGGTYLPFLVANDAACTQQTSVEVPIFLGRVVHKQPPFKWQQKCLRTLRASFGEVQDNQGLVSLLSSTGCLTHLVPSAKL